MHYIQPYQDSLLLIARILIVLLFSVQDAIYNKLINASRSMALMRRFKLPFPSLVLTTTVVVELFAGFCLLTGWYFEIATGLLILFTLGATTIFHRFWTVADPSERQNQLNHCLKNLAIISGLIYMLFFGPGHYVIHTI